MATYLSSPVGSLAQLDRAFGTFFLSYFKSNKVIIKHSCATLEKDLKGLPKEE